MTGTAMTTLEKAAAAASATFLEINVARARVKAGDPGGASEAIRRAREHAADVLKALHGEE